MIDNRGCMTGAATVVAAMRTISALNIPLNLIALIPLCENMPSGESFKAGDILVAQDGTNIAVHNTAHAAQLMMVDALLYAEEYLKPAMIIDIAAMSTGIEKAVGQGAAAVFTPSQHMWKQFRMASAMTGDRAWRFPLWKYYEHKITNFDNFDITNKGQGPGAPCYGASFLNRFVKCADFMHIDANSYGMIKRGVEPQYLAEGYMTGRPTRALVQFLLQMACPDEYLRQIRENNYIDDEE
jgi:aminopeptidase